MKRLLIVLTTLGMLAAMVLPAANVLAAPAQPPNGSFVNAGDVPPGSVLVLNVKFNVANDADSGFAGNYWALDSYNKTVQVWQASDNSFYAVVKYAGKFTTIAGQTSPGALGKSEGTGTGTFSGGYIATFTADAGLTPAAGYATRGNIGSFDFGGSATGVTQAFDWLSTFFTDSSGFADFAQPQWGWTYHFKSQTWDNAYNISQALSGDIVVP